MGVCTLPAIFLIGLSLKMYRLCMWLLLHTVVSQPYITLFNTISSLCLSESESESFAPLQQQPAHWQSTLYIRMKNSP